MAQLVERTLGKGEVPSSTLGISTISYTYPINYLTDEKKEADNLYFPQQNYQEYQVDKTIFKNCDLNHINSFSGSAHQITYDELKCTEKTDSLSNPSDQFSLLYFGFLYKNQISSSLSSTKKIFLSLINKLCNSAFGKSHDLSINLSNQEISLRAYGRFSPKQVQRHIDDLVNEGVIENYYVRGIRWIKIRKEQNHKFMPIVDCVNGKKMNLLNASEILILSKLLDKSSFLFKAGFDFTISKMIITKILSESAPLSKKSITRALIKIKSLGLIIYENTNSLYSDCKICSFIAQLYSNLFKIKVSKKCCELIKKQAIEKILRKSKDSQAVSIIKFHRERKRRLANCEAEKARPIAETASYTVHLSKENAWNRLLSKFFGIKVNQSFYTLTQAQVSKVLDFFTVDKADKKVFTHNSNGTKKSLSTILTGQKSPSFYINKQFLKNTFVKTDLAVSLDKQKNNFIGV